MNTEMAQHYLIVPDDHEDAMEIEHPPGCPTDTDEDGSYSCVYAFLAEDLDAFFVHAQDHDRQWSGDKTVQPGGWPVRGNTWFDYWGEGDAELSIVQPTTERKAP